MLQAVLQIGGQLELEVRPLFLVPDTNGFIDHLGGLKKLLQCGVYIIVVPLIGKATRNPARSVKSTSALWLLHKNLYSRTPCVLSHYRVGRLG